MASFRQFDDHRCRLVVEADPPVGFVRAFHAAYITESGGSRNRFPDSLTGISIRWRGWNRRHKPLKNRHIIYVDGG
jgi:hypothetical protein